VAKKQPTLLAASRRFRFDDIRQTSDGNFYAIDDKKAPFVPDALEGEDGSGSGRKVVRTRYADEDDRTSCAMSWRTSC